MSRKVELPEEVVALLGDDPAREALEALLLHLIRADRASVAWAGEKLGLDRWESIRWYTSHGYPYPDYSEEDLEEDLRHAEGFASREREADEERTGFPEDRGVVRREEGVRWSNRPRFCPNCGAALEGENAAVGILDGRSGDGGYDTSCRTCGWSGDIMPDDEQGRLRVPQEPSAGTGGRGSEVGEITHRLRGSIRTRDGESADEKDYRRYLEREHG